MLSRTPHIPHPFCLFDGLVLFLCKNVCRLVQASPLLAPLTHLHLHGRACADVNLTWILPFLLGPMSLSVLHRRPRPPNPTLSIGSSEAAVKHRGYTLQLFKSRHICMLLKRV